VGDLRITEVMYNPLPSDPIAGDEYEFIELKNTGSSTIPLAGITFTAGISYTFPAGASVPAGGFVVLPHNLMRFNERYGSAIGMEYTGSLSNGGERLTLVAADGSPIASVAYDDVAPWPTTPDGGGMSLVPKLHNPTGNPDVATIWRASTNAGGSPGADDPPAAPSALTATAISTSAIDLTWSDNANDETAMEIARDAGSGFVTLTTTAANVLSVSDAGLTNATAYTYRVRAINAGVPSAWSATASATTLTSPPAAPSGLIASATSAADIALMWVDNASNETAFEIERDTGSGFTALTTTTANTITCADTGLTPTSTYTYRVRAVNAGGASAWSASASATTLLAPPAAPNGLAATVVSATEISLAWVDNASDETALEVERDTGSGFAPLTTTAANVTAFSDTGLTATTTYTYRVRAVNAGGPSTWSASASATTQAAPGGGGSGGSGGGGGGGCGLGSGAITLIGLLMLVLRLTFLRPRHRSR
jgi:hypothetical protein